MVIVDEFRAALARFPSGVTIVTARGERAGSHGLTVSAFCSVSAEPPMVLVCIARSARTLPAVHESGRFAVSMLRRHHDAVARLFATTSPDKFQGTWGSLTPDGPPVVPDALFSLECTVHSALPAGDHEVVIGAVQAYSVRDGAPLVYYQRAFHPLATAFSGAGPGDASLPRDDARPGEAGGFTNGRSRRSRAS
ncbi:flavin reductase family protein [Streptosporangium sp. DT93]|uniref:flavin reductase family protein n=1 Tax=Streptosporangium sp. DT93 TaxID=3393428 RepID=UPI003CF25483